MNGIRTTTDGNDLMTKEPKKTDEVKTDVDPVVPDAIGKQLKRMYDDVADEPVPDRFAALLDQLAGQEQDEK